MPNMDEIKSALERIAPPGLAEEWDNSGFQVRITDGRQIRRILVSLEISGDVVSEAISKGADMIVTHHPLIFGKISKVDDKQITGNYLIRLIQAGISVYSAHTSFDSALNGTNQYLAEQLGLEEIRPLAPSALPGAEDCGMGRTGVFSEPLSFEAFMQRLVSACDRNIYRIAGKAPESVSKVSLCTGAGAEFIGAAAENGSDVYITGDVKYHDARDACETGVCVVDAGHFGTENIFSENFAAQLRAQKIEGLEVLVSESDLNPFREYALEQKK